MFQLCKNLFLSKKSLVFSLEHNQTIYLDLLKRKTTSKQSQIFDQNHRLINTIFSLFLLVKTRLVIVLLNDCVESPKIRILSKGLTHVFEQKMPISSLFRFGQTKTKNNA